jgi:hypothetical protein
MSVIWMDVDVALAEVPVNVCPLTDDTDFKTIEAAVAYNATGLALYWHFVTTGGAETTTQVTPTTGGTYDWANAGQGMYTIEIPASGGASINNDAEGFGYFTGVATGVLPWRGPTIGFRAAALNDLLIDAAFSVTRGLSGTALPDAAAGANGGLPVLSSSASRLAYTISTVDTYTGNTPQTGDSFARIGANGASLTALATAAQVSGLSINTRANLSIPVEIETPDASTQVYKIRLHLFDVEGNMEAPDSTPTIALTNAAGTDRSARLSSASNPSTGVYTWDYTATAGDAEEQLIWVFTVVEGGLTRTYPATSYVVEETAYRFSSSDRSNLAAIFNRMPASGTLARPTDIVSGSALDSSSLNTLAIDYSNYQLNANLTGIIVGSPLGAVEGPSGVGAYVRGPLGVTLTSFAAGDIDGFTLEETLKLCLAALAGKLSGAATATVVIRAADDSKPRITATVDGSGNRSAIVLDATG